MQSEDLQFWDYEGEEGKTPKINVGKLIKFWGSLGFRKYRMPDGGFQLIRIVRNSIVIKAAEEELVDAAKIYILNEKKDKKAWNAFFKADFASRKYIKGLDTISDLAFNTSTKSEAFFYFRNGIVKVAKNGVAEIMPYENYEGFVWHEQIKQRDFINLGPDFEKGDFDKFIRNVTGGNDARYKQLATAIGYMLHPHKDPSFAKAVILIDEKLDYSGAAHGGTGKTIISKAIDKIIHTHTKDGKNLNHQNNRFFYQGIDVGHKLLILDDVTVNFSFETLYSIITGDLPVEQKFKNPFIIPFHLSPKVLITSNYMVIGSGGATDERRRIEIEIAPHYSPEYTPVDEFGKTFFDEWSVGEWQQFDNLMLFYCAKFIEYGVMVAPSINLRANKLIQATSQAFVEFANNHLHAGNRYNKGKLHEDFIAYSGMPAEMLSLNRLTKWIDTWSASNGLFADHTKSNGNNMVTIFGPANQSGQNSQ